MNLDKSDDLNQDTTTVKKKQMTVEQFFQQFNTLDMNNYGGWPLSVKITCWFFVYFAVVALGYFIVIRSQIDTISNAQAKEQTLETEIPSLVEDINLTGVNSGLKFKNIRLEDEVKQEFFIEQPISIDATGDYHAFGAFVSGIAALPRIVTLHDFVVEAKPDTEKKSDIPIINYSINAKTYRYIGADEQAKLQKEQSAQPAKNTTSKVQEGQH